MLYQVDLLKRVAWAPSPTGFYYWSTVYYIDSADTTSPINAGTKARQVDRLTTRQSVTYMRYQIKSPPGRGNVITTFTDGLNTGSFTNGTGTYMLIDVARWRWQSSAGRWTYKYGRMPVYEGDVSNGRFVGFPRLIVLGFINSVVSPGIWRDSYGDLLVRGKVDDRVRMWQMRHGTKRRERAPF